MQIQIGTSTIKNSDSVLKKLSTIPPLQNGFLSLFSTRFIASESQISFALEQTLNALKRKTHFSTRPEHEFLLRVLGTKQLEKAFAWARIEPEKPEIALIGFSTNRKILETNMKTLMHKIGFVSNSKTLHKTPREQKELLAHFGISKRAVETLSDYSKSKAVEQLIFERIARLELEH